MNLVTAGINTTNLPDDKGYFGEYGGSYLPPALEEVMKEVEKAYEEISKDPEFIKELQELNEHFTGRPSPVYHAKRLSQAAGGAEIYLKREDLNHTGAHKINHCLGEVLLAKHMGKKKVIAETGAGQHGVALATAAALLGLECDIYMGEIDVKKEALHGRNRCQERSPKCLKNESSWCKGRICHKRNENPQRCSRRGI